MADPSLSTVALETLTRGFFAKRWPPVRRGAARAASVAQDLLSVAAYLHPDTLLLFLGIGEHCHILRRTKRCHAAWDDLKAAMGTPTCPPKNARDTPPKELETRPKDAEPPPSGAGTPLGCTVPLGRPSGAQGCHTWDPRVLPARYWCALGLPSPQGPSLGCHGVPWSPGVRCAPWPFLECTCGPPTRRLWGALGSSRTMGGRPGTPLECPGGRPGVRLPASSDFSTCLC